MRVAVLRPWRPRFLSWQRSIKMRRPLLFLGFIGSRGKRTIPKEGHVWRLPRQCRPIAELPNRTKRAPTWKLKRCNLSRIGRAATGDPDRARTKQIKCWKRRRHGASGSPPNADQLFKPFFTDQVRRHGHGTLDSAVRSSKRTGDDFRLPATSDRARRFNLPCPRTRTSCITDWPIMRE